MYTYINACVRTYINKYIRTYIHAYVLKSKLLRICELSSLLRLKILVLRDAEQPVSIRLTKGLAVQGNIAVYFCSDTEHKNRHKILRQL